MAISASLTPSVFGNYRIVTGTIDMGGVTSGTIETGLTTVQFATVCFGSSYTSGAILTHIACNCGSAGTAIPGNIMVLSATAGDVFNVFAIGE